SDLNRFGLGAQAFGASQRQNRRRESRKALPCYTLHRHHAYEIGGTQASTKPRGARGRKHVVRTSRVIARSLSRKRSDKYRAGCDRSSDQTVAVDDEMLWRE